MTKADYFNEIRGKDVVQTFFLNIKKENKARIINLFDRLIVIYLIIIKSNRFKTI